MLGGITSPTGASGLPRTPGGISITGKSSERLTHSKGGVRLPFTPNSEGLRQEAVISNNAGAMTSNHAALTPPPFRTPLVTRHGQYSPPIFC